MAVEESATWFSQFNGVFLGWFLGLFGTPAVIYLSSLVDRRRFENSLRTELFELSSRLGGLVFLVRSSRGTLEKTHVEQQLADLDSSENSDLVARLKQMINSSDDEFRAGVSRFHDPKMSKAVPKMSAPYLLANLSLVSLLSARKQKDLINLLHHLDALNSKSQDLAIWVLKTHEDLSPTAYDLVQQNISSSTNAIVSSAEMALVHIRSFLGKSSGYRFSLSS